MLSARPKRRGVLAATAVIKRSTVKASEKKDITKIITVWQGLVPSAVIKDIIKCGRAMLFPTAAGIIVFRRGAIINRPNKLFKTRFMRAN